MRVDVWGKVFYATNRSQRLRNVKAFQDFRWSTISDRFHLAHWRKSRVPCSKGTITSSGDPADSARKTQEQAEMAYDNGRIEDNIWLSRSHNPISSTELLTSSDWGCRQVCMETEVRLKMSCLVVASSNQPQLGIGNGRMKK